MGGLRPPIKKSLLIEDYRIQNVCVAYCTTNAHVLAPVFVYSEPLISQAVATMERVEQVRRSLLNNATSSLTQSIVSPVQNWLAAHPLLEWWVVHPVWALGLLAVAIALLVGLFGAIGRLTENVWITAFKALFKLLRWGAIATFLLLKALFGVVRRISQTTPSASSVDLDPTAPSPTTPAASAPPLSLNNPQLPIQAAIAPHAFYEPERLIPSEKACVSSSQTHLLEVLARLNALHREEELLLTKFKQLLTQIIDKP